VTRAPLRWGVACALMIAAAPLGAQAQPWPLPDWPTATPADVGMDEALLMTARDYALGGGGSGYVVRSGTLVFSWGSATALYDLKSTTKSIGVTALGLALMDGLISLDDRAQSLHPTFGVPPDSNTATGWLPLITVFHLATQTAGFDKDGGYTALLFEPGTGWAYSDGGPNWLAECVTLAYHRDLSEVLFERVFTPLGIDSADLNWRTNSYRAATIDGVARREFGSGVSADVDAMARIGYLYLRGGMWDGTRILPASFIDQARRPQPELVGLPVTLPGDYFNASDHYGLLWWNNGDGSIPEVPTDAYWSWGLYESFIIVIPSLDLVVSRAGDSFPPDSSGPYAVLAPFLVPIVRSIDPGTIPGDAGPGVLDGGSAADGGAPIDGGSGADGGSAMDGHVLPDGSPPGSPGGSMTGGCSCDATGRGNPPLFFAATIALLSVVSCRRRRRTTR